MYKMFLRYLWVLHVRTPRRSQIFLNKIIQFHTKWCGVNKGVNFKTFSILFKVFNRIQWLFKTTTKSQDLFKIVRTLHEYDKYFGVWILKILVNFYTKVLKWLRHILKLISVFQVVVVVAWASRHSQSPAVQSCWPISVTCFSEKLHTAKN